MSGDFAIVAEGITDHLVLKNIILGFFDQQEPEPSFAFVQPPLDETGRAGLPRPPGGWTLVLKYLQEGRYKQALQFNKYLVIQIDSDVCEDYGVSRLVDGRSRSPEEMLEAIRTVLLSHIDQEFLKNEGYRLLFAIGLDEIECWLLPLVFERNEESKLRKITGCLEAINYKLKKLDRGGAVLSSNQGKYPAEYDRLSKRYQKHGVLIDAARFNQGLEYFLEQLCVCSLEEQA